ncbi:chaplin [Streptomyces sp. BI20]|uniref:chaplin n=1 Tax=Streptomyces sp. BI20 TaxID=3403460 RepID=UPI003C7324A0
MRQTRRNGLIAAVVVGGAFSVGAAGLAQADSGASGGAARSPGLLSGNLVQLPVNTPVNLCGNTVSVVGLLNPAAGNSCANKGGGAAEAAPDGGHSGPERAGGGTQAGGHGGHGGNGGGASAQGSGKDSAGVISGNTIQLPISLPVNVSGNSVNVVGIGNGSTGNVSVNEPGEVIPPRPVPPTPAPPARPTPGKPAQPVAPKPPAKPVGQPNLETHGGPALAVTGAEGIGYLAPAGGALLLGGVLLYRRFRPTS